MKCLGDGRGSGDISMRRQVPDAAWLGIAHFATSACTRQVQIPDTLLPIYPFWTRFKMINTRTSIVEVVATASSSLALVAIGNPEAAVSTLVDCVRRATFYTETPTLGLHGHDSTHACRCLRPDKEDLHMRMQHVAITTLYRLPSLCDYIEVLTPSNSSR